MKKLFVIITGLALLFNSCTPQDAPEEKRQLPKVATGEVTNITVRTADCSGNVINDGGDALTLRGVCWSTSENPTKEQSYKSGGGYGEGNYTCAITGLLPNTTYYVRACASNSEGTAYGEQKIFTTNPLPEPSIISTQLIEISQRDVEFSITYENFIEDIHERGLVLSDTPNPTRENGNVFRSYSLDQTITMNTSGMLICDQTYYCRAFCTSHTGETTYGEEIQFSTLEPGTDVTRQVDEFEDDVYLISPIIGPDENSIAYSVYLYDEYLDENHYPDDTEFIFSKVITKDGSVLYYLNIRNISNTSYYYKTGVIILFDDETQLRFPDVEIECEFLEYRGKTYYSHFNFTSLFLLSESDVDVLESKSITDVRLYLSDSKVDEHQAINLQKYIKAMRAMN
ncbi:MAG: hypothetical protein GX660_07435 [Clostridiaceae bacterium]|nr:hypothetical protein [Clostridiaceae bacterium]